MSMQPGIIVIDGSDGVGKETVVANVLTLLNERRPFGQNDVLPQSFPNYESFYGKLVKAYLKGDDAPELLRVPNNIRLDPICASVMYAMDRYRTYVEFMQPAMEAGHWFLCDRYYTSNMGHQGSRINTLDERREFWDRLMWLELKYCQLPEPRAMIILDLPDGVRQRRLNERREAAISSGETSGKVSTTDIHEQDPEHMRRAADVYRQMSAHFGWPVVNGVQNGQELSRDEMAELVYGEILQSLGVPVSP